MNQVVFDSQSNLSERGTRFRRGRPGPESELIEWFLDQPGIRTPRGFRKTVFREPRLKSGFPDLVVVIWNEKVANQWHPERAALQERDIRILHHLAQQGRCAADELDQFFKDDTSDCLNRLRAAQVITHDSDGLSTGSMKSLFAVQRIIAIEAKVSQWSAALDQASLNTWFASDSYVLLPHIPRGRRVIPQAAASGIGVWCRTDGMVLPAVNDAKQLPRSYASWLFNEWVWRAHTALKGGV